MRGSGAAGNSDYVRGMSLAFEFVGAVFLFWFLGRLLDGWLGTEPWIQIGASVVGWVGGFLHLYYWAKASGWQDLPAGAASSPASASSEDAGKASHGGPSRDQEAAGAGARRSTRAAPDGVDEGDGLGGQR